MSGKPRPRLILALVLVVAIAALAPHGAGLAQPSQFDADPTIAAFVASRGGIDTFGLPVTSPFRFLGFTTQIFQRRVVQIAPDGSPRLLNLLDAGLMPYNRFNGSTFPDNDLGLIAAAPRADASDYAYQVIDFVRGLTPDDYRGQPVNFFRTFSNTVTCASAFPNGDCDEGLLLLMNLEMWGVPTSLPQPDPANANFVYQRFQRGIMHFDAACGCTRGILLGDYFKSLLWADGMPPDLEAEAHDSPLLASAGRGAPDSDFSTSGVPFTGDLRAFAAVPPATAPQVASPPPPPAVSVPGPQVGGGIGGGGGGGGGGGPSRPPDPPNPPPQPTSTPPPTPTPGIEATATLPPEATSTPESTATPTPLPIVSPTPTSTAPAIGTVVMAFDPPGSPAVGDLISLTLRIKAGTQQLDGAEVHVDFDPAYLQVVDSGGRPSTSITPGPQLDVVLLNRVDQGTGHIDFAAGKLTAPFPSGDFVLAIVEVKALSATPGSSTALTFVNAGSRRTVVTFSGAAVPLATAPLNLTIH